MSGNKKAVSSLVKLIGDICKKVVDARIKNVPKTWVGTVVSTSSTISPNGSVQIHLNGDLTSTPVTLKNKTFESINANDECYIFSPVGKLSNSWVAWKK